jgi:hypothetical protein
MLFRGGGEKDAAENMEGQNISQKDFPNGRDLLVRGEGN